MAILPMNRTDKIGLLVNSPAAVVAAIILNGIIIVRDGVRTDKRIKGSSGS